MATAALQAIDETHVEQMNRVSRHPRIVADAAYVLVCQPSRLFTYGDVDGSTLCRGNFVTDEDVLRSQGMRDFEQYRAVKSHAPLQKGSGRG